MKLLVTLMLFFNSVCMSFEKHVFDGIEFFIEKPEKEGKYPAIVMVHGYQPEENSLGGRECLNWDLSKVLLSEDIVVAAISIPGFGETKGKRDYCGPIAQNAVITLIDHLQTLPYIENEKIGLVGVSRGANTAAMVSTKCDTLAFQVLVSGKYDFSIPFSKYFQPIQDNYLRESNGNWKDRSALYHVEKIGTPTLILQGALDPLDNAFCAQRLYTELKNNGTLCRFVLFPHLDHFLLKSSQTTSHVFSFVREQFYHISGIGVELSPTNCYPQIRDFLIGYPAEKSPSLRIGDIILGISPKNDETMISVFCMPTKQIARLILGLSGTKLRLKIAHLPGLEEEEIVIDRMRSFIDFEICSEFQKTL